MIVFFYGRSERFVEALGGGVRDENSLLHIERHIDQQKTRAVEAS